ncbi:MAG: DUF1587 domain-containing protein [Planctomycetes bacterium]|nr:DUF1587 domain-containing protein [Planctomycetota bacterium]
MKSIPLVLMLAGTCSVPFVFGQEQPLSLEAAREQGRARSRYTKETKTPPIAAVAAPKANLAEFQRRVQPILTESCLGCHGPKVSKGNFRVDQLNPDLLAGPDAERWQEVSHSLGKSEMPPENDKKIVLTDKNRTVVLDWLREELDKASQVRRTTKQHSSFRRLTNYEYDYAVQDLLGVPFSLPQRLPPESATEDGFKNSSELLQLTGSQFEIYRELALKALRRATVVGDRPKPVVYTLSVADEVAKVKGGSKNNKKSSYPVLNRETGKVQVLRAIGVPSRGFTPLSSGPREPRSAHRPERACRAVGVQDVDFGLNPVTIREGKGAKDRLTVLPSSVVPALKEQLDAVRALHRDDLAAGFGRVYLPAALAVKYPGAAAEWGWQYVFPSAKRSTDPRSGGTT